MKVYQLFFVTALLIVSCTTSDPNKELEEGSIKNQIYTSQEIGWTIEIPKGYEIVSKDKVEANEKRGSEVLEKTSSEKINTKLLKHLIVIQKDRFNALSSTSEPFTEEFPGEFQQTNKKMNELLYRTYIDQGVKTDTSSGKETIQNLEFETFYTTVYSPKGDVGINLIQYSKLINGFSFGVTICYTNAQDKKTLLDAFNSSKFKN